MTSLATGQDKAILAARDCPFGARENISLRLKQEDKSFLWQNFFRDSKIFFSDFSVGMKLEPRKAKRAITFAFTFSRYHNFSGVLVVEWFFSSVCNGCYLTMRPVARKSYGAIAHKAKPNGLLNRGP